MEIPFLTLCQCQRQVWFLAWFVFLTSMVQESVNIEFLSSNSPSSFTPSTTKSFLTTEPPQTSLEETNQTSGEELEDETSHSVVFQDPECTTWSDSLEADDGWWVDGEHFTVEDFQFEPLSDEEIERMACEVFDFISPPPKWSSLPSPPIPPSLRDIEHLLLQDSKRSSGHDSSFEEDAELPMDGERTYDTRLTDETNVMCYFCNWANKDNDTLNLLTKRHSKSSTYFGRELIAILVGVTFASAAVGAAFIRILLRGGNGRSFSFSKDLCPTCLTNLNWLKPRSTTNTHENNSSSTQPVDGPKPSSGLGMECGEITGRKCSCEFSSTSPRSKDVNVGEVVNRCICGVNNVNCAESLANQGYNPNVRNLEKITEYLPKNENGHACENKGYTVSEISSSIATPSDSDGYAPNFPTPPNIPNLGTHPSAKDSQHLPSCSSCINNQLHMRPVTQLGEDSHKQPANFDCYNLHPKSLNISPQKLIYHTHQEPLRTSYISKIDNPEPLITSPISQIPHLDSQFKLSISEMVHSEPTHSSYTSDSSPTSREISGYLKSGASNVQNLYPQESVNEYTRNKNQLVLPTRQYRHDLSSVHSVENSHVLPISQTEENQHVFPSVKRDLQPHGLSTMHTKENLQGLLSLPVKETGHFLPIEKTRENRLGLPIVQFREMGQALPTLEAKENRRDLPTLENNMQFKEIGQVLHNLPKKNMKDLPTLDNNMQFREIRQVLPNLPKENRHDLPTIENNMQNRQFNEIRQVLPNLPKENRHDLPTIENNMQNRQFNEIRQVLPNLPKGNRQDLPSMENNMQFMATGQDLPTLEAKENRQDLSPTLANDMFYPPHRVDNHERLRRPLPPLPSRRVGGPRRKRLKGRTSDVDMATGVL